MSEQPRVLAAIPDLMFQSRVREQAEALGFAIAIADTMQEAAVGLDEEPNLLVVDLQGQGIDAGALISSAKERGVPVLAYGRHTEAPALRAAREAGANSVVVRSTFVEEMAQLLREHARGTPNAGPR